MKINTIIISLSILFSNLVFSQLKTISYLDGKEKLEGIVAIPSKTNDKKIGIVILPAWMGITDHEKESAQKLAGLGYFAFVADIYGVGNNPTNPSEAGKLAGFYKNNYQEYQKRIQLAIDQVVKNGADTENIVVIGYCFGGTGALEAARGGLKVKGVISFHGGLGKDAKRETKPFTARVLALHGADDPFVPATEVVAFEDEMRTAKADWQLNKYSNAVHAFTHKNAGNDNSKGAAYNEKADIRSWEAMKLFLTELFN